VSKAKSRVRNYSLVVIDMQPYFSTTRCVKLVANCLREIKAAKRLGNHVMLVRLGQYGKSLEKLYRSLRGYDNRSYVTKWRQSGATDVLYGLPKKTHLKFCGVNTDLCVQDTVLDIANDYPRRYKIEVVADACASWNEDRHTNGLCNMANHNRVTIL
jgi:nicotinamidase-related amidase